LETNGGDSGGIAHTRSVRSKKPFIVRPHTKFTKTEYVDALKSIAAIIGVVPTEDELIVKDESDFSASSSSESGSPDKDKKF
jgi:hypothetical protein